MRGRNLSAFNQESGEFMNEFDDTENNSHEEISEGEISAEAENTGSAENTKITENTDSSEAPAEEKKPFSGAVEWVNSIVFALTLMLALSLFVFRSITVSGDSMNNTLLDQDKVIVMNFFYEPKYGDIVVLQADRLVNKLTGTYGEAIIKRVIAVEGDTVLIDFAKGEVYRNGELLEEDYIKDLTHFRRVGWIESNKEYTVPKDCVFVMGDNRNVSNDSRNLEDVGFVNKGLIMGKAFVRYSPIKDFKWL